MLSNGARRKKNIVIIAGFAESLLNFRGKLIERLCSEGHQLHVAAPFADHDEKYMHKLVKMGVQVHALRLTRAGVNPFSDIIYFWELCRVLMRVRPDFVFNYTIKPVVYGGLASWLTRVPERCALITGLGYAFIQGEGLKRKVASFFARSLYFISMRCYSRVFFQNSDDRNEFYSRSLLSPKSQVFVVNGSGVDTSYFEVRGFPNFDNIAYLFIGRFLGDKGIREYVAAAQAMRKKYANCTFYLVGDLDDNPDSITDSELRAWQEEGAVCWLGKYSDVRSAIEIAHVYVLPSYREGTPRTVLESMSMGRPIVTTQAPGCRETVEEGVNGFLVPVKEVDELELAMSKFMDNPYLIGRMGKESRRIATQKYDVDKVNSFMLENMNL